MSTRTALPLHPTEAGDWPPKKKKKKLNPTVKDKRKHQDRVLKRCGKKTSGNCKVKKRRSRKH